MGYHGVLKQDTVWQGKVGLEGDVVVPPGVTLRLLPGTEVVCAQMPRWSCSVFRSAPEGYPIEASDRARCDLVVLGRLEASGERERPVRIGCAGAPWGGITLLEEARASLNHLSLSSAQEHLLQCFDDSRADVADCSLAASKVGVMAWGLADVRCREVSLEDVECGSWSREGSCVSWERAHFKRLSQGVLGQHWSLARLMECRFEDCGSFGAGSYDRCRLTVTAGEFFRCGQGIVGGSDSVVEARGTRFLDNRIGVQGIEKSYLHLVGCRLEDNREQGAKFSQSSRSLVEQCALRGNRLAGIYSEDEANVEVTGCDFDGNGAAVATAGRGKLEAVSNRL